MHFDGKRINIWVPFHFYIIGNSFSLPTENSRNITCKENCRFFSPAPCRETHALWVDP